MKKQTRAKKIAYRFILPDSLEGRPIYAQLRRILDAHHQDVSDARFALAWNVCWTPDVDGRIVLGQCRRVGDLDREIVDQYDFIIVLNRRWWEDPLVATSQRDALLDHECSHAAVKYDAKGEPVVDERGRTVYRTKKHEIEDFISVVERHGTYKRDLEVFATALDRARHRSAVAWPGYTSLQHDLHAAGLSVPLDVIVAWTDDERREARTWALLRSDPLGQIVEQLPTCLARAVSAERTTA